ncbi:tyrosine-type recombinase/integrase [Salipaludibacillus daqingensis]|uniref:tyrosine-type recombinase/integrase n=1 Tax=Salipaludibacillus daqingensis TaxID=3041001 RepID=UPI0024751C10|nr:site-specific integrase [Salipaludibacillus daqingensis]
MTGSVKKEGNSWYYVFSLKDSNGKRKQKKKRGFKTKKAAQQALTESLNSYNKGSFIEPSNACYNDYLTEWFDTKKNTIGIQTAQVYEIYLNKRVIPSLGDYKLSELSTMQIQSFINKLHEEGLSRSTIKKNYEIIRNSLEHAVDYDLLTKNVSLKVKLPRVTQKEMNVWNEKELTQFLEVAKEDQMNMVFFLALMTGMRQGEILGLRWKDIDLNKRLLSIKQTLTHDGKTFLTGAKTKSSLRTIYLSKITVKALQSHKAKISKQKESLEAIYTDYDLVVCSNHGTPLNPANVRRSLNQLIVEAKVPKIRFHDLRHTHATSLLSKGINVKVVSERLGHSNIKITLDTYSHVLPTMQEDVMQKLDEMILT